MQPAASLAMIGRLLLVSAVGSLCSACMPAATPATGLVEVSGQAGTMRKAAIGQPLQIGEPSSLPQTATVALTAAQLQWLDQRGGTKQATLHFTAPGAAAIRLGITVMAPIPPGTVFRFSASNGQGLVAVTGEAINALLQSNVSAGDRSEDGRTYWSPDIDASEAAMQVELAPSVSPAALAFYVGRLSYLHLSSQLPAR